MKRTYLISLFLIFTISGYAQNKIAKGYVLDAQTRAPIDSAIIAVADTGIYTYADVMGYYSIQVPKKRRRLDISHPAYSGKQIHLKPGFQHRNLKVYLGSYYHEERIAKDLAKIKQYRDSLFNGYKNVVTLSAIELFAVAIAPRYERFIGFRHSAGLHASFYIYGHSSFDIHSYDNCSSGGTYTASSNYNGFKMAPFYRYYVKRDGIYGIFVEGKVPFGYFDFYKMEYHVSSTTYYRQSIQHNFWTWGAGISVGAMTALPRSQHGVINFSIGYQYFPMVDAPDYIFREISYPQGTTTLRLHNHTKYWYMPGPGSTIEVKFLIGGIF